MSSKLDQFQNAYVGMTVGIIEVLLLQPLNYAKNMVQQQQKISLNPSTMYRGVGASCTNMGSCTMIQFAIGGRLKQVVLAADTMNPTRHLNLTEEMFCGFIAGFISAIAGSPLGLVMIQQQRHGGSTAATLKNIMGSGITTFARGFTGCAIREALWTCGYLSIPCVVRRTLIETYPDTFPTHNKARVPAALIGAFFACYLSHPFDTIKTCMQGDIERKTYGTFSQTAAKIMADSSLPGFYRGASFRYGRMVCAVFILDYLKCEVAQFMYPDNNNTIR